MNTTSNFSREISENPARAVGVRLVRFVVGFSLWAIAITFFMKIVNDTNGEATGFLAVISLAPMIAVFAMAMGGCPFLSSYQLGTIGNFLKFFAFLLLMMTVIGMLPIAYWTGKCITQWVAKRM